MTETTTTSPVKIGDLVTGEKDRLFTIRSFPSKIGHADGAVFEGFLVMDEKHVARWEADTFAQLAQAFHKETGVKLMESHADPAIEVNRVAALEQLQAQSKLRPMPTLISRETGEPFQKPREMRITGLVADLRPLAPGVWRFQTQAEADAAEEASHGE